MDVSCLQTGLSEAALPEVRLPGFGLEYLSHLVDSEERWAVESLSVARFLAARQGSSLLTTLLSVS